MAIGPNLKTIKNGIKEINTNQKLENTTNISSQLNSDVSKYIQKNPSIVQPSTNPQKIGTFKKEIISKKYDSLLQRVKSTQTKIVALNTKAVKDSDSNTEELNKFLAWTLPSFTKVSITYDYKDKFTTDSTFTKWAKNFTFIDDPTTEYVPYNSATMSEKSATNRSDYSKYFTSDGLASADAYKSYTDEALSKYNADAENVLVISSDDLTQNPHLIDDFLQASTEDKNKKLLKESKYIFWGNPDSLLGSKLSSVKKDWKKPAEIMEDKADLKGFLKSGKEGYGAYVNGQGIAYIKPEVFSAIEPHDTYKVQIKSDFKKAVTSEAIRAANKGVSNLTIANVQYGTYKTGDRYNYSVNAYTGAGMGNQASPEGGIHAWDIDWGFGSFTGDGFIGDVIYSMYQEASKNNIFATSFGRYINEHRAGGVATKSEMDLDTTASFNLINATINRKLHVATCIGFTTYTTTGSKTIGYITSSETTIPSGTDHDNFATGRIAALNNIIASGEDETHTYNSNSILNMLSSGPDFMANLFDVYFIKAKEDSTGEEVRVLSLTTSPKVIKAFQENNNTNVNVSEISSGLPITSGKMLKSPYDFISRVAGITIPSFQADTIEYNFQGQTYTTPGYKLQHDFSSSLKLEMDAGLEYMRTINKISGFINGYTSNDGTIIGGYHPLRNRLKAGNKISLLVKLTPGNMFYNPSDSLKRYIIFEDVVFTGGGQVTFSQTSAGLVSVDFKFIYKNVALGDFPMASQFGHPLDSQHLRGTTETGLTYAPAIQQLGNIKLDKVKGKIRSDDTYGLFYPKK